MQISQLQSRRRDLKLRVRFGKCEFVGSSINCEKEVALPSNVPVLEKYSSKRTAYLRAQFDLRNRRQLAKEAQPRIDVLRQRLAHHDLWECSRRSIGGTSTRPRRILEPCTHKHYPCQPSGNPQLGRRSSTDPPPLDRKSTRLNSSHTVISYAVFCLKKKKNKKQHAAKAPDYHVHADT